MGTASVLVGTIDGVNVSTSVGVDGCCVGRAVGAGCWKGGDVGTIGRVGLAVDLGVAISEASAALAISVAVGTKAAGAACGSGGTSIGTMMCGPSPSATSRAA